MQSPDKTRTEDLVHSEGFLRLLMRRQLRLSVACAVAFLAMLFGLPLANYLLPEIMAVRVFGGVTLTWFLLGIGVFPVVWMIAWIFIKRSMALEDAEVREVRVVGEVREVSRGGR